jgi:hypothetical protein
VAGAAERGTAWLKVWALVQHEAELGAARARSSPGGLTDRWRPVRVVAVAERRMNKQGGRHDDGQNHAEKAQGRSRVGTNGRRRAIERVLGREGGATDSGYGPQAGWLTAGVRDVSVHVSVGVVGNLWCGGVRLGAGRAVVLADEGR